VAGWSVSFAVDVPAAPVRRGERAVGVDLGLTTFAALSDGGIIPALRAARKGERRMRLAQRALARKKRVSRNRAKAKVMVARAHAAIARVRTNHLHQASARLLKDYDIIVLESLNVTAISRSGLAKAVHDASWARFVSMLRYKAEWAGARLIEVNCQNTSSDCSGCGANVPKTLDDRLHNCPACGLAIDRDLNAARNILSRAGVRPGPHNVAGYGMRAGGNIGAVSPG
jgi:putative transposase